MKKLIKEYDEKVLGYDIIISNINMQLSCIRRGEEVNTSKDELLLQRGSAYRSRQIYIQIIEDLKNI